MNNAKYNYIFYGDTNEFAHITLRSLNLYSNVVVKCDPFESKSKAFNWLYKSHTYPYVNRYIELPFKKIWNNQCAIPDFSNDRPLCFVFQPKYTTNRQFLSYLRDTYIDCKLVLEYWDLVDKYKKWFPKMNIEHIEEDFDLVLSFNKYDCEKYGFTYYNAETQEKQNIKQDREESDVVFIGNGKGRISKLIEIYDIVTSAGYKCFFYIVDSEYKKYNHGDIIFTKKLMPYMDLLQHEINSRCILELVQEGQCGFSSRSKEAFIYNKKLITDNKIVKDQRFYPSKDICFIEKLEDINLDILRDNTEVDFGYDNDYSCGKVLELIESIV